jgi:hypothetical protein
MAVYKIIGTFGNSFSNSDQINLFVNSGTIVPSTTTKFQLEQGIFVTVNSGVTITAYTSNGTCANISDAVDVPNTPVPEPTEEFDCNTTNLNLTINNGTEGDNVTGTAYLPDGSLGTITGFSPSFYSTSVTTYRAFITIPSGYSNTGDGEQVIGCDGTATVTPITSSHLYYTYEACDGSSDVDVLLESAPFSSIERRIDYSTSKYYTYSGDAGTSANSNPIKSLDLISGTGCPPLPTYYYIAVRECTDYNSNGALEDRVVRSLTDITGWSHVLIPRYSGDTGAVYEKYGSLNQSSLATAYEDGTFDLPSVDLDNTASSNGITVASLEKTTCP